MKQKSKPAFPPASLAWGCLAIFSAITARAADLKFDFGSEKPLPNFTKVTPDTVYDAQRHYGFIPNDSPVPNNVQIFAADVEEGNYTVTLRFGNPKTATSTTVKAESRRLMVENVTTEPGKYETRTFTVNVRRPKFGNDSVKINGREEGPPLAVNWDDSLSLEFSGKQPGVISAEIAPAKEVTTVFLAGDSTVTDQRYEPFAGWGQMLPRFFQPTIAISNHAESGLALKSFERQKRLAKILSMMKKGDYLFIQFGHNDQKDKSEGAGPFTTYKENLKTFISGARGKGGIPILFTPMERLRWDGGSPKQTLADYAEAVRQVGDEEKVPVIDLNAMSLKLYGALGEKNSTKAFVFYPAKTFPGQEKPMADRTHHNAFGGYELARCVVEGIKAKVPELAKHLTKDAGTFNPETPDDPEKIDIPRSRIKDRTEKPAGS
ncbi:MAG: rhamnogalacturonan acetylesterase [Luteolibacter sp.]